MEPDNPDTWPEMFEQAGFAPLSTYVSVLVSDLAQCAPLINAGVVFRSLRMAEFENELRGIYKVSRESFTRNFLYTEIPEEEFLQQYFPYKDKISSELVLITECEGKPVGYLFGIPDFAEAMRGAAMKTVIAKTLAVLPAYRCMGLGTAFLNLLSQRAREMGFTRVIHALQREGNRVLNISSTMGRVMRRYTLYSKRLGQP
jgi:GNAT superfamily N-acetyltransferase